MTTNEYLLNEACKKLSTMIANQKKNDVPVIVAHKGKTLYSVNRTKQNQAKFTVGY